jgi:SNF2 family DNA or RNA helicase
VFLKGWRWGQVVLDEAHALKNAGSGRVTRLRALARKAVGRLMLTGTPLQNDLGELLNLLGFLLPKVFEGEALGESTRQGGGCGTAGGQGWTCTHMH